jgi:hypothetical protein
VNTIIHNYLQYIQEGVFSGGYCKKQCKEYKNKIDFQICIKLCYIKINQERLKHEIFDIERRIHALDCTPKGVEAMRKQGQAWWTIESCNKEKNELINDKKEAIAKSQAEINKLKNEIVELKKRKKG